MNKRDLIPLAFVAGVAIVAWLLSGCAPEPVPAPAEQLSQQEIELRHQEAVARFNREAKRCQSLPFGTGQITACLDAADRDLRDGKR